MPQVDGAVVAAAQPPVTNAIGTPAPEYRAVTLAGAKVDLAALRGSPVLLNVWATWCEPCRHELPILDRLRKRLGPRGLRVVAASVDRDKPPHEIAHVIQRRGLDIEVWLDPDDHASRAFGIATLPVTLLFDATGTLVWRRDGAIMDDDPALASALERVLTK